MATARQVLVILGALVPLAMATAAPVVNLVDNDTASTTGNDSSIESLSQEDVKELLELLPNLYARPEDVNETAVARAHAWGLVTRLSPGLKIGPESGRTTAVEPPLVEQLAASTGYIRLGDFTAENVGKLDDAIARCQQANARAIILDLRATPPSSDFDRAADAARRFAPRGRILFTLRKPRLRDERILTSRTDPKWRGPLAVLVDSDTTGAVEVLAAVLRTHAKAIIFGQRTRGEAVEFSEVTLRSGTTVRVASGEIVLPDRSKVFPGGIQPDVEIPASQESVDAALAAASRVGVEILATEPPRPRLNERALLTGENPELDALHAESKARTAGTFREPLPIDLTLQRAHDFVRTLEGLRDAAVARPR
jgi:hypothetical protein